LSPTEYHTPTSPAILLCVCLLWVPAGGKPLSARSYKKPREKKKLGCDDVTSTAIGREIRPGKARETVSSLAAGQTTFPPRPPIVRCPDACPPRLRFNPWCTIASCQRFALGHGPSGCMPRRVHDMPRNLLLTLAEPNLRVVRRGRIVSGH